MSRMFLTISAAVALTASAFAQASTWNIDSNHTAPQFAVRHMGISTVRGSFTKSSGTVNYDPSDLTKTTIQVTIDTASVDTRVSMRDDDLKKNYFEVDKFPTMSFKSTGVQQAGPDKLKVAGDLTIKGVTKPVVLEVDGPSKPAADPKGNLHMGASATTQVNRHDFGVGGDNPVVGDIITLTIDVEMVKPAAAAGK